MSEQEAIVSRDVARRILETNLRLSAGESLLVVTDTLTDSIGRAFFDAGVDLGAVAVLVMISPTGRSGAEPPPAVASAMQAADVLVCPTRYSLTHTQARLRASERGARTATLPGIRPHMLFEGALTVESSALSGRTRRIQHIVSEASGVTIESSDGSRLEFSILGRSAHADTGELVERGACGNLPAGEAYIAPLEGTANGDILVDGSIAGIGRLDQPVRLHIERGQLVSADGEIGMRFLQLLGPTPESRNIAEFGIGTNDRARLTGIIVEDEKVLGTIHVAFGDNSTFGGTVRAGVHLDAIVTEPEVVIDGKPILIDGVLET
jgi:leucyl aminopeptidase (aminopeptidase T)